MTESLLIAGIVLELAIVAKIYLARLYRAYRWFVWFLAADALQTALLLAARPDRREYAMIWTLSMPVVWILYLLFVLEIYSLVLAEYSAVARMARWVVIVAAVTPIVLLSPQILHNIVPIARAVPVVLLIAMLFPWIFAAAFAIRMRRNVAVHATFCTALLAAGTVYAFWREMGPAIAAAGDLCLAGWLLFLSKPGEKVEITPFARRDPERVRQLQQKAAVIDRSLMRSANWGNR